MKIHEQIKQLYPDKLPYIWTWYWIARNYSHLSIKEYHELNINFYKLLNITIPIDENRVRGWAKMAEDEKTISSEEKLRIFALMDL